MGIGVWRIDGACKLVTNAIEAANSGQECQMQCSRFVFLERMTQTVQPADFRDESERPKLTAGS